MPSHAAVLGRSRQLVETKIEASVCDVWGGLDNAQRYLMSLMGS